LDKAFQTMDITQARQIIEENIKYNYRHADYQHTVDLAYKYFKLITGKNIDTLLARFNPRESAELFEQRKRLTIAITPEIIGSIIKPFRKVARTTPLVQRREPLKDQADAVATDITEIMDDRVKNFYGSDAGNDGLDYFLETRFTDLSFTDPNAWIVVEFDPFDPINEKAKPRPWEVPAANAYNFKIRNNMTEWLLVGETIMMMKPGTEKKPEYEKGTKYTLYGDMVSAVYEQTLLKREQVKGDYDDYVKIESNFYIVREFDINVGRVPAFRVGYVRDIETAGRTFVAPFHDAMPTLDKSIKVVSEYDLSHCLHVFPQKVARLQKACPGTSTDRCIDGKTIEGTTCSVCKGTGESPFHRTAQDVITVEMPENIKQDGYIPLNDYVHYVELPTALLEFQKKVVDEFTPKAHQAIFNSTALVQKSVQSGGQQPAEKTAFEVDSDMDSVYDTLYPFAKKYSAAWMGIVDLIATMTDFAGRLSIVHRFPTKFSLKTKDQLFSEYQAAQSASLPSFVTESLSDELAETLYMDDPEDLIKYRVKKRHFPFVGKTQDEIGIMLSSSEVLKETKILFNYFERIFTDIEAMYSKKGSDFYILAYEEQKQEIDSQVEAIKVKLAEEMPVMVPFNQLPGDGVDPDPNNPDPNQPQE
jgi:hypothetical protein